jgi:hypothetical protein
LETIEAGWDCEKSFVAFEQYLYPYHDERGVEGTPAEVTANTGFALSDGERAEFETYRGSDEKENKCRGLGFLPGVLVEEVVWEKLCGARKPDQYLLQPSLSGPNDPGCDCPCVPIEGSDHYG